MDDTVKELQRVLKTSTEHTLVQNMYSLKQFGWAGVQRIR